MFTILIIASCFAVQPVHARDETEIQRSQSDLLVIDLFVCAFAVKFFLRLLSKFEEAFFGFFGAPVSNESNQQIATATPQQQPERKGLMRWTYLLLGCNTVALFLAPNPVEQRENPYADDDQQFSGRIFLYHLLTFSGSVGVARIACRVEGWNKAKVFVIAVLLRSLYFGSALIPYFHQEDGKWLKTVLTYVHSVGTLCLMWAASKVLTEAFEALTLAGKYRPFAIIGVVCVMANMLQMLTRLQEHYSVTLFSSAFEDWVLFMNKVGTGHMMSLKCFLLILALVKEQNIENIENIKNTFVRIIPTDKGQDYKINPLMAYLWLGIFYFGVVLAPIYHMGSGYWLLVISPVVAVLGWFFSKENSEDNAEDAREGNVEALREDKIEESHEKQVTEN